MLHCKNCGVALDENVSFCPECGAKVGVGNRFCGHCGQAVYPEDEYCANCHAPLKDVYRDEHRSTDSNYLPADKDKVVAILLCLFLGGLGIHNFYLGETKKGIIRIVFTVLVCGLGELFALIDLILLIVGSYKWNPDGSFF